MLDIEDNMDTVIDLNTSFLRYISLIKNSISPTITVCVKLNSFYYTYAQTKIENTKKK